LNSPRCFGGSSNSRTTFLGDHAISTPGPHHAIVTPLLGSPQRLEARLFMSLKRLLVAECERYPLLIVIENLE